MTLQDRKGLAVPGASFVVEKKELDPVAPGAALRGVFMCGPLRAAIALFSYYHLDVGEREGGGLSEPVGE